MAKEIEVFEFHYINGDTHMELPTVKDVVLTKKSQTVCNEIINRAKRLPAKIRNEVELETYLQLLGQVKDVLKRLEISWKEAKEPYARIGQKIETAIWQKRMELETTLSRLKGEIARFEEERRRGAAEEQERLLTKAKEAELKARYADNPEIKRVAKNQALEYEEEAKRVAPKPVPGIATRVYWEPVLDDPLIVFKTHKEFLDIRLEEDLIQKHLTAVEERGEKIKENSIPGIRLVKRSTVAYRR